MRSYPKMSSYPVGSQVEQKNGYVRVKVSEKRWQGLGAYLLMKSGVKIEEGDRVFFADGDRTNRSVENLRRIHFSTTRFVMLPHSRPIYIPDVKPSSSFNPAKRKIYAKVA